MAKSLAYRELYGNLDWTSIDPLIKLALAEDIGSGDTTTKATIPSDLSGRGLLLAKSCGILAGIPVAERVIYHVDERLSLEVWMRDGDRLEVGTHIGHIKGPMGSILTTERIVLNFLQRLSGIASQTDRFVEAVKHTDVQIMDTRKTTPGWRGLEKYAVRIGGGCNHRFGLYDAVLIKDNHIAAAGGIQAAVDAVRLHNRNSVQIEVEVENTSELDQALDAKVDIIMLDNMTPDQMRQAVQRINGRATVEASGGIRLENIAQVAETGVDFISVGALTHSAMPLDLSLEVAAE